MSYLNGISYSKILITDTNYVIRDTIFLPLTGEMGLEERSIERFTEYESLSFVKKKKTKGWDMHFTLDFSHYANATTALKIMALLNWEYAISNTAEMYGYRIFLFPRVDMASRYFEVIGNNKEMIMKVLKGGLNCAGHSGLVLKYQTKYLSNWSTRAFETESMVPFDEIITV